MVNKDCYVIKRNSWIMCCMMYCLALVLLHGIALTPFCQTIAPILMEIRNSNLRRMVNKMHFLFRLTQLHTTRKTEWTTKLTSSLGRAPRQRSDRTLPTSYILSRKHRPGI